MTLLSELYDETDTPEEQELDQPEAEASETDAPQIDAASEEQPAEVAPPATDLAQTVQQLAASMLAEQQQRATLAEQTRQAEAIRQQQASAPKPLMDQEAWRSEYEQAIQDQSWDDNARKTLIRMNQELMREEARNMVAEQTSALRLEMQADTLMQTAAREALTPYGGMVQESDFQAEALRIFGGNRAAIAQALSPQNPEAAALRETLADAAFGRAYRAGRVKPGAANPAPPANPRSAARPAAGVAPVAPATDVNAEIAALWSN